MFCYRRSRTTPRDRRPATRPKRRSPCVRWGAAASPATTARSARSARRARGCRQAKQPRCSTAAKRRSTASCGARAPRSRPACQPPDASARRCPTLLANAISSDASPTLSSEPRVVGEQRDDAVGVTGLDATEPYQYQGPTVIGSFLHDRAIRRGSPLRLIPTRANTQPAYRVLRPLSTHTDCTPLGAARAHPRGRGDLGNHLVRRQQRLPPLRAPPNLTNARPMTVCRERRQQTQEQEVHA
jgi:hypothetical protein